MAAFDAAPLRNGSGPADAVCTLLLGSNQSCMGSGTDELGGGVGGNDMPPMTSAPQGMGWHGLLPMWLSSAASSLLNSFMQHGTSQNTAANSWPTAQLETSCISPRHHSSPMGNDSHSFHAACVGTHGITPSSSPAGQGASSSSAFGLPAALFHVSHTAVLALLLVCVSYVVETAYYKVGASYNRIQDNLMTIDLQYYGTYSRMGRPQNHVAGYETLCTHSVLPVRLIMQMSGVCSRC